MIPISLQEYQFHYYGRMIIVLEHLTGLIKIHIIYDQYKAFYCAGKIRQDENI